MRLWTPPRDQPELLAWWGPLLLVARMAREERLPWAIHIDQFHVLGRVDRGGSRLPIWVYRHAESGGDIYADPAGQTYRYRPTPKAAGAGRFDRCELKESICLSGLPDVVEPVCEADEERPATGWAGSHRDAGRAAHPTAQRRDRCRPASGRVPQQDRWLHAVPALPA